jgi:hypothetical protein
LASRRILYNRPEHLGRDLLNDSSGRRESEEARCTRYASGDR